MNAAQPTSNGDGTESPLSVWISWGLMLVGIGAVVLSAYIVITTYSPLPHWDEWALFDRLATGGGLSLPWLWAQHNEHRILTTKLFFLLDVEFFHGTQAFLLICIFLAQLLQAMLLSLSLRVLGGMRGTAWRIGTGLIAYCVFCPTQYENLVWGFQLQFVITSVMATLAIFSLLLYHRNGRAKFLIISVGAASVATWSLANGMLLWPLLIGAALWLRMKRPAWTTLFVFAVVNVALYFFHYHRPSPHGEALSLHSVLEMAEYVAVYFGSTWVRHSSTSIALTAGIIGIGVALFFIVRVLRTRSDRLLEVELSSLMLLFLATAAITSSGRLHLGLEQATASRYQTFALVFWCCLGLLLILPTAASRRKLQVMAIGLAVILLGFATQARLPLIDAQWHQLRLKIISVALLAGVHDPAVLAEAFPDPQVVLRDADYMRQHRLSIFAGKQYEQLGQPLDSQYHVEPESACLGSISSSQELPTDHGQGLRLTGFAWDRQTQKAVRDIVATSGRRIIGFGTSVMIPVSTRRPALEANASRFGWIAFAGDAAGKTQLYAVTGENQSEVCPFAESGP